MAEVVSLAPANMTAAAPSPHCAAARPLSPAMTLRDDHMCDAPISLSSSAEGAGARGGLDFCRDPFK